MNHHFDMVENHFEIKMKVKYHFISVEYYSTMHAETVPIRGVSTGQEPSLS